MGQKVGFKVDYFLLFDAVDAHQQKIGAWPSQVSTSKGVLCIVCILLFFPYIIHMERKQYAHYMFAQGFSAHVYTFLYYTLLYSHISQTSSTERQTRACLQ